MNVLLIAPDVGLASVINEVRAVSMALRAVALTGTVTRKDVLDTLPGHTWDIIWFATHGNEAGIMLSDGPVEIADLTAIVRNTHAYLVVLNTCSSRYVGLEMHYELGVDVVCTQADAGDLSAYQTGVLLARNLADNMSVADAFEQSRPGQKSLYFLFSRNGDSDSQTLHRLNAGFASIERRMDNLEQRFGAEIEALKNSLNRRSLWRSVSWLLGFFLLLTGWGLLIEQIQLLLDLRWPTALLFSAFFTVASIGFLMYGNDLIFLEK